MARINCFHTKRDLRIYINELLHFQILKREYVGMKSYIEILPPPYVDPNFSDEKYIIEFTTTTGIIKLEYALSETWEEILKLLDKHL